MTAFYNENDPAAAHVLRCLSGGGVIAPGTVDARSIKDLHPDDLGDHDQHHFFAGGGLWSVAARMAGWPDTRSLWTASCPCQPFSVAGKGAGDDDPRHLWPDLFRLVRARRPRVIVGEQVGGKAGVAWLDGVRADLESIDYTLWFVEAPACAVDAPHQRIRIWWVAVANAGCTGLPVGSVKDKQRGSLRYKGAPAVQNNAGSGPMGNPEGLERRPGLREDRAQQDGPVGPDTDASGAVADAEGQRSGREFAGRRPEERAADGRADAGRGSGDMADTDQPQFQGQPPAGELRQHEQDAGPGQRDGSYWSDAEWIECHDGKARRTKPGLRLLVVGFPGRVDLWRIAGNAIVPQVAAEVLAALMDVLDAN